MARIPRTASGLRPACCFGALLLSAAVPCVAQNEDTDWSVTTGSKSSQRYAPLDQIDAANVSRLERLWIWTSPDVALVAEDPRFRRPTHASGEPSGRSAQGGNRLYTTTALYQIAAIDPGTGATVWSYDPEAYADGRRRTSASRTAVPRSGRTAQALCRRDSSTRRGTRGCAQSMHSAASRSETSATAAPWT